MSNEYTVRTVLNNILDKQKPEPIVLVSEQDLTATQDDLGSVIDMRGFTKLGLFIDKDVNDSENVDLEVLGKHTSDGTYTYEIDGISTKTLWTTSASDGNAYYEFDVGAIPYIQVQAVAGTVGTTPGDLTITITKRY